MLKKTKILIFILTFAIYSCEDEQLVNSVLIPEIIGISRDTTFYGDEIIIYGKNFGNISGKSSIVFDDNDNPRDTMKWIASEDCLKWTETEIIFLVEEKLETSDLSVCVRGVTSNKMKLIINPTPKFEMIEIFAGVFLRGSNYGFQDEYPVKQINITDNYYIAKFEVNQELWQSVMKYNKSLYLDNNFPVHNVDWIEAIRFCNRLSVIYQLDTVYQIINDTTVIFDKNAKGYRLPTEAEWEYACKAGTSKDFPPSDDVFSVAWFIENSGSQPHKSGQKSPNPWGIYDMQGNVWEWCWDWYDENYYSGNDTISPTGPNKGIRKVLKGGSFISSKNYVRSSNRMFIENNFESCGFRIVKIK